MGPNLRRLIAAIVFGVVLAPGIAGQGEDPEFVAWGDDPELTAILERIGERAGKYTDELQRLAWTNVVRHEVLDEDGRPIEEDKPRELTFEMIVRLEPAPYLNGAPLLIREEAELTFVDGEPVEPNYEIPSAGPQHGRVGSSWFLLPEIQKLADFRDHFRFSYAERGDLRGRDAIMVDAVDLSHKKTPPRVVRPPDNMVSVVGVAHTYRIWIDPETYDVLQIDTQLGPVEFVQGRNERDRWRFERRWSSRFKTIAFEDPERFFLVPESSEMVTLLEGESPAVRRAVHSFTDYRRFTGEVRITPLED